MTQHRDHRRRNDDYGLELSQRAVWFFAHRGSGPRGVLWSRVGRIKRAPGM